MEPEANPVSSTVEVDVHTPRETSRSLQAVKTTQNRRTPQNRRRTPQQRRTTARTGLSLMESSSSDDESENERPRKLQFGPYHDDMQRCLVKPRGIKTTFADVHVHSSTIEALENFMLPMRHPAAFEYGILSKCASQSVLLYGPPGTGKSLLVRALAKQSRTKILAISGADIWDKYVGTGEKKIKELFALARHEYPCIIFIDEADAMFRSRSQQSGSSCYRSYLNQFLSEMDGINSENGRNPVVIAATSRPFDIDEGILRRLGRRIMIDLPDALAREEILKIHLRGESLAADVDISELAKATANYTGSDLKNLVYSAAVTALREELDLGGRLSSSRRILCRKHFLHAKREIPASPIADTAAKIHDFHNKFGNTVQTRGAAGPVNKAKSSAVC
ncbi:P-loop containing nucleoside triphosphate hydrolase protein [Trichoderma austrokoningii]